MYNNTYYNIRYIILNFITNLIFTNFIKLYYIKKILYFTLKLTISEILSISYIVNQIIKAYIV